MRERGSSGVAARLAIALAMAGCARAPARHPVASPGAVVDVGALFGIERDSFACVTKEPGRLRRALAFSRGDLEPYTTCRPTTSRLSVSCSAPCRLAGATALGPTHGELTVTGDGWLGVAFDAPGDYVVRVGRTEHPVRVRAATELRGRIWQDEESLYVEATVLASGVILDSADPEIFVDGEAVDAPATKTGVRAVYARSAHQRRVQIYYRGFYVEARR
ncbi:MAG: hypothetical protein R3B48_29470 [Kofleriaceae bacterium]